MVTSGKTPFGPLVLHRVRFPGQDLALVWDHCCSGSRGTSTTARIGGLSAFKPIPSTPLSAPLPPSLRLNCSLYASSVLEGDPARGESLESQEGPQDQELYLHLCRLSEVSNPPLQLHPRCGDKHLGVVWLHPRFSGLKYLQDDWGFISFTEGAPGKDLRPRFGGQTSWNYSSQ